MDHLPSADSGGRDSSLQVPFLVPPEYFEYYPRGVIIFKQMMEHSVNNYPAVVSLPDTPKSWFESFSATPRKYKHSRSEEGVLQSTQIFLFFGLLVEIFFIGGVHVDIERFIIRKMDGKDIITTSALNEYICYLHVSVQNMSLEEIQVRLDSTYVLFRIAADWLISWASILRFVDPPPSERMGYSYRTRMDPHHRSYPRAQTIILSIRILYETLQRATASAYSTTLLTQAMVTSDAVAASYSRLTELILMQGDYTFVDQLMVDSGRIP
jgi:hypothetical protein